MPRGKNYVNNNKGMVLLAGHKSEKVKEACFYGPACNRKDCIYDHSSSQPEFQKTNDPCMAFLAGHCAFTAKTCRKRHPTATECERLLTKYRQTKCRFGDSCKTNGCLYQHGTSTTTTTTTTTNDNSNANAASSGGTVKMVKRGGARPPPPLLHHEAAFPPLPGTTMSAQAHTIQQRQQQHQDNDSNSNEALNIHAKEFVPGGM